MEQFVGSFWHNYRRHIEATFRQDHSWYLTNQFFFIGTFVYENYAASFFACLFLMFPFLYTSKICDFYRSITKYSMIYHLYSFNEKFIGWEFYFNRKRKPWAIVLKSLLKIFFMQYNIIKMYLESFIRQRGSNTGINVVNTNYHKCTNRKQFANFWSRFHSHNSLRNTFTQPFQFPYKMTIFQRH